MRIVARRELTAVLVLAAAVRLFVLWRGWTTALVPDLPQEGYFGAALNWLDHGVFTPDAANFYPQPWRGPLYPAFLALTQMLGRGLPVAAFFQAALAVLACWAAYGLAARLHSREAGLLAALALAVEPASASVYRFDLHPFYGALVLAVAAAAAWWAEKPDDRRSVLFGAAFGASLLCRTTHLLAFPLVALAVRKPRPLLMAAAAAVLALAPYLIRNELQFGDFGLEARHGAYSAYAAAAGLDDTAEIARVVSVPARDVSEEQERLFHETLELVRAEPGEYALGVLRRLWRFWAPLLPALLLIAAGWRRAMLAPALVLASFSLYALLAVQPHYAHAARPLAFALAACGAAALLKRKAKPEADHGPAVLGGALALCYAFMLVMLAREAAAYGWPSDRARIDAARTGSGAKALTARGIELFKKGDAAGAAAAFRSALAAEPGSLEAALSLAAVAPAEGKPALKRALALGGQPELRAQARRVLEAK